MALGGPGALVDFLDIILALRLFWGPVTLDRDLSLSILAAVERVSVDSTSCIAGSRVFHTRL